MVLEDHDLLLSLIADALRLHGLDVVLECGRGDDAIIGAQSMAPEAAVLDISLGEGPNGVEVGHVLRSRFPRMGLVFLTSYEDPRLLGGGADLPEHAEYLTKDTLGDIGGLIAAIERSVRFQAGSRRATQPAHVDLTDAQIQTLRLVSEGYTNAQIAVELGITVKAVEQSITRIARRLGVADAEPGNQRVLLANEYLRLTIL